MLCRTRISFPPSSGLGLLKTPTMNHCWLTWKLLKKKTCLQNKPPANGVASPVIHSKQGNVFSGSHTSRSSKKGPCLWEESAFFESFKHQNRSVFASETCTKLKKDTVDVQFSFTRILLWDISTTLQAHPLKKKNPFRSSFFVSSQWRDYPRWDLKLPWLGKLPNRKHPRSLAMHRDLIRDEGQGKEICKTHHF